MFLYCAVEKLLTAPLSFDSDGLHFSVYKYVDMATAEFVYLKDISLCKFLVGAILEIIDKF